MKNKIVQWLFYLLYLLCTVGMFLGFLFNTPVMIPFSMIMAVLGVVAEADYFRPRWPVKGTKDYQDLVHKIQDSIIEGKAKAQRGEKL